MTPVHALVMRALLGHEQGIKECRAALCQRRVRHRIFRHAATHHLRLVLQSWMHVKCAGHMHL